MEGIGRERRTRFPFRRDDDGRVMAVGWAANGPRSNEMSLAVGFVSRRPATDKARQPSYAPRDGTDGMGWWLVGFNMAGSSSVGLVAGSLIMDRRLAAKATNTRTGWEAVPGRASVSWSGLGRCWCWCWCCLDVVVSVEPLATAPDLGLKLQSAVAFHPAFRYGMGPHHSCHPNGSRPTF